MSKILVAYFSPGGTTARAAKALAQAAGADIYEIRPEQPYTQADLDWTDKNSRSSREMGDPGSRPFSSISLQLLPESPPLMLGFGLGMNVRSVFRDAHVASEND